MARVPGSGTDTGGSTVKVSDPEEPELLQTLPYITYTFKGDKLLIEPKESIKARLGFSPDHADALALTFAAPVSPRAETIGNKPTHKADYNPMAEYWR